MKKKKYGIVSLRKGIKKIDLDLGDLRTTVLVLRAINHPLRQEIMGLLEELGTLCVTDIYTPLRLEQSVASQHLAILRRAFMVQTERQGKNIYYSLIPENVARVKKLIKESVPEEKSSKSK